MTYQKYIKHKLAGIIISVSILSACSSSDNGVADTDSSSSNLFNVSGRVLGLKDELVIENSSGQAITLKLDGDIVISADVPEGTLYDIRIISQPEKQYCEIINGQGSVTQDIDNISIFCNDPYFFSANQVQNVSDTNNELWVTDGTASGTRQVSDINPSGSSMWQQEVIVSFNGNVYFGANDGTAGRELWRSDGTDAGTVRLTDATSSLGNSSPDYFTVLNNKLLFNAFNDNYGYRVSHAMDALENVEVLSLFTLQRNSDIHNDRLFFENYSFNQADTVIMSTEGSLANEHLFNSEYAFDPHRMKVVGDRIFYLSIINVDTVQLRVVEADGSTSPRHIASFSSVDSQNISNDYYKQVISFKDKLFFNASDGINGHTMWYSDGTADGTQMLFNPDNGSGDTEVSALTVMGDKLFFAVNDATHRGLWVTDGTSAGTQQLNSEMVLLSSMAGETFPVVATVKATSDNNQLLFYRATSQDHGAELWVSDGTPEGTRMVSDIMPGTGGSQPFQLVARNGYVLFAAISDDATGTELWRSDGTAEGTYLVKDICEPEYCGGLAGLPPS